MPEISRFYGIIIYMYSAESPHHHLPHFHARYGEHTAVVALKGDVLAGSLPSGKMKLVLAWAVIHNKELQKAWKNLQKHEKAGKIEPLQ